MSMRVVLYAICKCYVWPLLSDIDWGINTGGRCERCQTRPTPLNSIIGPKEALEIFKEDNGNYPEPIGPNPWFSKYIGGYANG